MSESLLSLTATPPMTSHLFRNAGIALVSLVVLVASTARQIIRSEDQANQYRTDLIARDFKEEALLKSMSPENMQSCLTSMAIKPEKVDASGTASANINNVQCYTMKENSSGGSSYHFSSSIPDSGILRVEINDTAPSSFGERDELTSSHILLRVPTKTGILQTTLEVDSSGRLYNGQYDEMRQHGMHRPLRPDEIEKYSNLAEEIEVVKAVTLQNRAASTTHVHVLQNYVRKPIRYTF